MALKRFVGKINNRRNKDPINHNIEHIEMIVIDYDGTQLGVLKKGAAIRVAEDQNLDLVLVSEKEGKTPVTRVMDYGKEKYIKKQKEKNSSKSGRVQLKKIQFRYRIGNGDFETKINHCKKFLSKGYHVHLEIYCLRREMQHINLAKKKIMDFLKQIDGLYELKSSSSLPNKIIYILQPK